MHLRSAITTVLLLAATAAAAGLGCTGINLTSDSAFPGTGAPSASDTSPEDGGAGYPIESGAGAGDAGLAPAYKGNPLCFTKSTGINCDPELTNELVGTIRPANAACGQKSDAGPYACHVSPDGGTECLLEGTSRDSCLTQAACVAGYECVGAHAAMQGGQCRRYCCEANVCEPGTFCDVQDILKTTAKVPVCMPIAPCQLLAPDACPGQTCGVVDESKGLTSCVDVGPRLEGDECETDHCGKDLACLGTPGSRKCFKLCDTTGQTPGYQCAMGQRCRTNGVTFKAPNVGICGT